MKQEVTYENNNRRTQTRAKLAREPTLVPVNRICMTDIVDQIQPQDRHYAPICLVPYANKLYYIVDGNHRFAAKCNEGAAKVAAWVLCEEDRELLHGEPLTTLLDSWKRNLISFMNLCEKARERGLSLYPHHLDEQQTPKSVTQDASRRAPYPNVDETSRNIVKHLVSALEALGYDVFLKLRK